MLLVFYQGITNYLMTENNIFLLPKNVHGSSAQEKLVQSSAQDLLQLCQGVSWPHSYLMVSFLSD